MSAQTSEYLYLDFIRWKFTLLPYFILEWAETLSSVSTLAHIRSSK